jgi:deferrochelatase/peroxidase EfeB
MHELQAMKAANAELTDENGKLLQEMLVGRTSEAEQLMATADRLSAARWSLDREIAVSPAASHARLDCSTPPNY